MYNGHKNIDVSSGCDPYIGNGMTCNATEFEDLVVVLRINIIFIHIICQGNYRNIRNCIDISKWCINRKENNLERKKLYSFE